MNANYLRKYNQPHRKLSEMDEYDVRFLYLLGFSSIKLASIYNCSKPVILRTISDLPKRKCWEYSNHRSKNQFGSANPAWKGGIKSIQDLDEQDLTDSFFYKINNGLTLCGSCHKKEHKLYGQ
jgi:hypothetical protein